MLRQNGMDIGQFQSTHPVRGATIRGDYGNNPQRHFNPRTP